MPLLLVMRSLGEKFYLLFLFFKLHFLQYLEKRWVRKEFPRFYPQYAALKKAYRHCNPYKMTEDPYGETPLKGLMEIAKAANLKKEDLWLELGCGRGKGLFFLHHWLSCKVIGIDRIPFFIQTAQQIGNQETIFRCEEMLSANLDEASVIYLYGTCLKDEEIAQLCDRFARLPSAVRLITVSYPLSDYDARFSTLREITISFPWGKTEVYLNSRVAL
ncbi:MAG: class I SAM-dependent methyltransferase [Verrucomicrobia bacterium]|nr:class I SAM-dependent methyltransferase [Verrucomicrobiota bacterium]